jgi:hypothetical protein
MYMMGYPLVSEHMDKAFADSSDVTPFAYADAPSADRCINPLMPMYQHNPSFEPEYRTLQKFIPAMAKKARARHAKDMADVTQVCTSLTWECAT